MKCSHNTAHRTPGARFPQGWSSRLCFVAAMLLMGHARAEDTATYVLDVETKLATDQRSRAISDSLLEPSVKATLQFAHESGWIGLAEINTVSKKQFLHGNGSAVLLAVGHRGGEPEGWRHGLGLVAEVFPGAHFEAPHAFDPATGEPGDVRRSRYDSAFALLEIGWGPIDSRLLGVLSKHYRGANTGSVCGTVLAMSTTPAAGLNCYGRGDRDSRGTLLFDISYTHHINPATSLVLHAGVQRVRNFREANAKDVSISLKHRRWGLDWTAEWVSPKTNARELYLVRDGSRLKATDNSRFVLTLARKF